MRRVDVSADRLRDDHGFTLIEAIVAAFVLVAGLLATVGVFNDSRDQNATGERHEIAVMQAEQALEEMRGKPYDELMLPSNQGAVEPAAAARLSGVNGTELFRVNPDLDERLVYGSSAGGPSIAPVTSTTIGPTDAPLDLTIHRFVTWRDEECPVVDLDGLGLGPITNNLTGLVNQLQSPLNSLLGGLLQNVLGLLGGNPALSSLKLRLERLNNAFLGHEAAIGSAVNAVTDLDLCDIELSLLQNVQQLGLLVPRLSGTGQLIADLHGLTGTLQNALGQICLPFLGCPFAGAVNQAVGQVNAQLNCMFGTNSQQPQFDAYLDQVLAGIEDLANPATYDTDENTKRITVAVVVEPQEGVGPEEPIWASSVVRDPSGTGLLTAGGAACT